MDLEFHQLDLRYDPLRTRHVRAARNFPERQPAFAVATGLVALHWLTCGYDDEITAADVFGAHDETLRAAEQLGAVANTRQRIRQVVPASGTIGQLVTTVLASRLALG